MGKCVSQVTTQLLQAFIRCVSPFHGDQPNGAALSCWWTPTHKMWAPGGISCASHHVINKQQHVPLSFPPQRVHQCEILGKNSVVKVAASLISLKKGNIHCWKSTVSCLWEFSVVQFLLYCFALHYTRYRISYAWINVYAGFFFHGISNNAEFIASESLRFGV